MSTANPPPPDATKTSYFRRLLQSGLRRQWTYWCLSAGILLLDMFTGPYLQFPVLFVIPVALSAWYVGPRQAYALAVILPLGRLIIAEYIEPPVPFIYTLINCLTRIAVISLIAYLIRRVVRQTRELEARIADLVTICAWSRTVEYEGEWISFEQYLLRRFNIVASHGISPEQAAKLKASSPATSGKNRPSPPAT